MKESTVHSLVIARTLLERADSLCSSEDRYIASAGLVILQDGLEIVLYALILELGIDEQHSVEKSSFDELLGLLRKAGVPVERSGTLKLLNKQRVLTKHHAQVSEPTTVRNYYAAAKSAIDAMVNHVVGCSIRAVFISDILADCAAKTHLQEAERAIQGKQFLEALIEVRKAIFLEFERDYSVYDWREHDDSHPRTGLLGLGLRGGWRAPAYTRRKDWIDKYVQVPTEYIQIDHQDWKLQAIELGIHTTELQNLRILTPAVFKGAGWTDWSVTYDVGFPASNANEANALYCLDRAVWMLLKKQEHKGARRFPSNDKPFDPPLIYIGNSVYKQPSTASECVHVVREDFDYTIHRLVGGFDPVERFYELEAASHEQAGETLLGRGPAKVVRGYLHILLEDDLSLSSSE